jgi:hypothetical protein
MTELRSAPSALAAVYPVHAGCACQPQFLVEKRMPLLPWSMQLAPGPHDQAGCELFVTCDAFGSSDACAWSSDNVDSSSSGDATGNGTSASCANGTWFGAWTCGRDRTCHDVSSSHDWSGCPGASWRGSDRFESREIERAMAKRPRTAQLPLQNRCDVSSVRPFAASQCLRREAVTRTVELPRIAEVQHSLSLRTGGPRLP